MDDCPKRIQLIESKHDLRRQNSFDYFRIFSPQP